MESSTAAQEEVQFWFASVQYLEGGLHSFTIPASRRLAAQWVWFTSF